MPVKVLIERSVRKGYEGAVWQMLRDMRAEAVRTRGYLYGETWQSVDNPRVFMVLSVWSTLEHWEQWAKSEGRLKMDDRIGRLLRKPLTVRIFQDGTDPSAAAPLEWTGEPPQPRRR